MKARLIAIKARFGPDFVAPNLQPSTTMSSPNFSRTFPPFAWERNSRWNMRDSRVQTRKDDTPKSTPAGNETILPWVLSKGNRNEVRAGAVRSKSIQLCVEVFVYKCLYTVHAKPRKALASKRSWWLFKLRILNPICKYLCTCCKVHTYSIYYTGYIRLHMYLSRSHVGYCSNDWVIDPDVQHCCQHVI